MLPRRVTFLYSARQICRAFVWGTVWCVAAGAVALAQGPLQERLLGRRITAAPAIADRIETRRMDEKDGGTWRRQPANTSRIVGMVVNAQGVVLPRSGNVVVRTVQSGRAVAQTAVDEFGAFHIATIEPGLYSAELLNPGGWVLTSTPVFAIAPGQIVHVTPVLSQSSTGALAQFLKSGTAVAISAAAGAGILALAPVPAPRRD